jgi:hypothetical protein
VNYPLGRRLVLDWLDANGGSESQPAKRWALYGELYSSPHLPSDLAPKPASTAAR